MTKTLLLQEIENLQKEKNYITDQDFINLSEKLKIPVAKIYETASFYSFLSTEKKGKYVIRICFSPSCEQNGAKDILEIFQKELNLSIGETSKDGKFSLELTSCVGCCNKPPAALINKKLYTELTEEKIKEIIKICK